MTLVRIWVYDGVLASGVSGPIDVFTAANHFDAKGPRRRNRSGQAFIWRVESVDGRPVRAASGQVIAVDGKIDARKRADAVLVTAPFVADMDSLIARRELLDTLAVALQRQHKAGAIIASYCTGAYVLAEAGLLDDRIATTHWDRAADFARRYPRTELRAHEILTEQDRVLCGGAVTSFLNLAVRLVEICAGRPLATMTAKAMLIDIGRTSQASYGMLLSEHGHTDRLVAQAQQRMEATLARAFRLSELAAHLAVSERTLHRRFRRAVGDAPLGYLQTLRVEVAKRLLETGRMNFEAVSEQVGYRDVGTFRELFKRKTGVSPREYQRQFATAPVSGHPAAPETEL